MVRLPPEQRTEMILDAAFKLAVQGKLYTMSARNITELVSVKCSPSTIKYHFGSLKGLRIFVIRRAIRTEQLDILALAIVSKDDAVSRISVALKDKALASIKG